MWDRGGFRELLRLAGELVVVPLVVADEILRRGRDDPAAVVLTSTPWVRIAPGPPVPPQVHIRDRAAVVQRGATSEG